MAVGTLSLFFPVFVPACAAGIAYAGHRALYMDWKTLILYFFTGPGRTSRIILLVFAALNLKSLPLGWTVRIFHSFLFHMMGARPKTLPQRALFHYAVTSSRTSLLETDYNIHKSNSTYFADVDVSRSHLVTHLLSPGMPALGDNENTKFVLDKDGKPVKGSFGIGLGAVFCSFRKEIGPLQGYEMWSRIVSWDRKWLYIVTHFVVKGKVKPTSWDGRWKGPTRSKVVKKEGEKEEEVPDWSKYIHATAISKYVFKLGRFTVHPSIMIKASGLLPDRPGPDGGWRGGEDDCGEMVDLGDIDSDSEWDWKRVEFERRKGLEYAQHFGALDGTNSLFDGGEDGAIGKFPVG
ncbi:hypothetical protein QBC44DRAFT_231441 [Cladorrhinum sp. PSN332]|nr:hypothetical protein QBC44DRAFT_231441 [Cladorrhinum sp. PSN332]